MRKPFSDMFRNIKCHAGYIRQYQFQLTFPLNSIFPESDSLSCRLFNYMYFFGGGSLLTASTVTFLNNSWCGGSCDCSLARLEANQCVKQLSISLSNRCLHLTNLAFQLLGSKRSFIFGLLLSHRNILSARSNASRRVSD